MRGICPRKLAFRTARAFRRRMERAFRRRMEKEWVAIRSTKHPREAGARKKRAAGVAGADGAGRPPLAPERTPSPAMTRGNPGCADALGHSPVRADRIRNDGDCLRGKASADGSCFALATIYTIKSVRRCAVKRSTRKLGGFAKRVVYAGPGQSLQDWERRSEWLAERTGRNPQFARANIVTWPKRRPWH